MGAFVKFLEDLVLGWVGGIEAGGYLGIFLLMAIESSFLPLPSEIVMLPAGILARDGKLDLWGCIAAGTVGSLVGALFNYFFAIYVGRAFLYRFGKYLLISEKHLHHAEEYWTQHGEVATFVGRLLPVIRHLISIPAGLARMNLGKFCLYTTLGAAIWVTILTLTGYYVGNHALEYWESHKIPITLGLFGATGLVVLIYLWRRRGRPDPMPTQAVPSP